MKIASWNVNSLKVRLPQVLDWLRTSQADILALQETKLSDKNFPVSEIEAAGYQVVYSGQKTYNGVALLSKSPARDIITDIPGLNDHQRRILCATIEGLRIINLYVPNGQAVGSEKYTYKLEWLNKMAGFIQQQLRQYPRTVVLGDFNIAPDDRDVHDPAAWREQILCSTQERQALEAILQTGLNDSFRLFDQPEQTFSWWDYRAAGFRRNAGLRIDLILTSQDLSTACHAAYIDRQPRTLERPSDHTPAVAEFDL